MLLQHEADHCRREAMRFEGKPEAPFLLHLASAFEELALASQAGQTAPFQDGQLRRGT